MVTAEVATIVITAEAERHVELKRCASDGFAFWTCPNLCRLRDDFMANPAGCQKREWRP